MNKIFKILSLSLAASMMLCACDKAETQKEVREEIVGSSDRSVEISAGKEETAASESDRREASSLRSKDRKEGNAGEASGDRETAERSEAEETTVEETPAAGSERESGEASAAPNADRSSGAEGSESASVAVTTKKSTQTSTEKSAASTEVPSKSSEKADETTKSTVSPTTAPSSGTKEASGLKNTAGCALTTSDYTYSGYPINVQYSSTNCSVSGSTSATEVGQYTMKFVPSSGYAWADGTTAEKSFTWKINRISVTLPALTYTSVTRSTGGYFDSQPVYNSSKVNISGTTVTTSAGTYPVVFSLKDKTHYMWENGTDADISITWTASYSSNVTLDGLGAALNADRTANGLPTLTADPYLMQVAAERAQEIVSDFSHNGISSRSSALFGMGYIALGENIAYTNNATNAETFETMWRNSPGHWANIISPDYSIYGVGLYTANSGITYAVQIFGDKKSN